MRVLKLRAIGLIQESYESNSVKHIRNGGAKGYRTLIHPSWKPFAVKSAVGSARPLSVHAIIMNKVGRRDVFVYGIMGAQLTDRDDQYYEITC